MKRLLAFSLLAIFFLSFQTFFVVHEAQQALVLQLGRLVRTIKDPGLYLKIPFLQETVFSDKRILSQTVLPLEVTLGDQKRAVVDMFLRYKINDPERFFKTVRTEEGVEKRIAPLVSGILRNTLGQSTLPDLLSKERTAIMKEICKRSNKAMQSFGLKVIDARILRADLPPANSLAIFSRMISERKKEAKEIRAQGEEKRSIIKADANLSGELILARAIEEAALIRGKALQESQRIYREAYSQNPDFANLYQTLEHTKEALGDERSTFILTPDIPFLRYFQKSSSKVQTH